MKTYIHNFLLLFSFFILMGACKANIEVETVNEQESYLLTFNISVLEHLTRVEVGDTDDPLNENKINNMHVFFYDGEVQKGHHSTDFGDLVITRGTTGPIGDALSGTATIYISKRWPDVNPYVGKNYQMYVLVNFHGNIAELKNKSLTDLKKHVYALPSYFSEQTDPSKKQDDFLMDGVLATTGNMDWSANNTYKIQQKVKLSRAAAKIRLRIKTVNVSNKGVSFDLIDAPQICLVRGVGNTTLFTGRSLPLNNKQWIGGAQFETSYQNMVQRQFQGEEFYARQIPFYSYENDWTDDGDMRTYLIVHLKLRRRDGDQKVIDSYYSVPVNYLIPKSGMTEEEKKNISKLQRNHLYDILCNITDLGSSDPSKPTELNAWIGVEDWNSPSVIDGNIAMAHYLVVKEKSPEMPNMRYRDIQYLSDLPLDLRASILNVKTKFTSYDYTGNEHVNTGSNSTNEIKITTREEGGKKYIRIESPIPKNYVPLEIKFRAQHDMQGQSGIPLYEDITVMQYPPIYVTAHKSKGVEIYWYSAFTAYNSNGLQPDGSLGAGYQTNGTLFKITTLVPQEGQIVGDPTFGAERTDRGEEANRITSPQFMIASQWGMSNRITQYNYDANLGWGTSTYALEYYTGIEDKYRYSGYYSYRYRDYHDADSRAYNYWEDEYGPAITRIIQGNEHGNRSATMQYTFRPKYSGRWRIPTLSELELVGKIQSDPNSAVKSLLWGMRYWSAQTNFCYNFHLNKRERYQSGELPATRAIFDTYNK